MAVRLADVEIDFAPRGAGKRTVAEALIQVKDLCQTVRHGEHLYDRFQFLCGELQSSGDSGGSFNAYAQALEELWRVLDAYDRKTLVEQLLGLLNHGKYLEVVHDHVEALARSVGMEPENIDEWQHQHKLEMDTKPRELETMVGHRVMQPRDSRDLWTLQDASVLLGAEIDKMQLGTSELHPGTREAVKAAFRAISRTRNSAISVMTTYGTSQSFDAQSQLQIETWFISESDLQIEIRPMGTGSFGALHVGKLRGHPNVVVKFIDVIFNLPTRNALKTEMDVLYRLRHPHIPAVLGANYAATRPFVVIEHAMYGSMRDYLTSLENKDKMWQLLYEGAQGLVCLHCSGVVRGDLQLSNILVSNGEKALIADFGLVETKQEHRFMSRWVKQRWRAPEYRPYAPTYESDIYSYAMCIYEAFSGEPPYGVMTMTKSGESSPRAFFLRVPKA